MLERRSGGNGPSGDDDVQLPVTFSAGLGWASCKQNELSPEVMKGETALPQHKAIFDRGGVFASTTFSFIMCCANRCWWLCLIILHGPRLVIVCYRN